MIFPAVLRGDISASSKSPAPNWEIILIEDHSELVGLLAERGIKNSTVLHVDAHGDLWPPPPESNVQQARALLSSGNLVELKHGGRFHRGLRNSLFNINNYLAMAHRLGLVGEVLWAYPGRGSPDRKALFDLRERIHNWNKDTQSKIDNLAVSPPFLKGTLSGVPISIGSLRDLAPASGYILDIDLDFFPEFHQNPVSGSYLGILASFVESIRAKPGKPALTVISYSHNGGYLPISLRFLGRWLHELLARPDLLSAPPPEAWSLKEEALYQMFFLQRQEAARLYRRILELRTDGHPDAWYNLGMILVSDGDHDGAVNALENAFRSDAAYLIGFLDAETVASKRPRANTIPAYLIRAEQLVPGNPVILDALGNYWYEAGQFHNSSFYYRKLIDLGHDTPLTHAYLGDSLAFSGDRSGAEEQYRMAIEFHEKFPDTFLPEEYRTDPADILRTLMKRSGTNQPP